MTSQKMKKYHFDVEMIIDHQVIFVGKKQVISTHYGLRGLTLEELNDLIRSNDVPIEENVKITFIIRGVNY